MDRKIITVPSGIRYISQWDSFSLPTHPCIINKQITGCGFTEYCLTNSDNVILCSPRKILLENKADQHGDSVLYAKSGLDTFVNFEKDLSISSKKPDKEEKQTVSKEEIKDIIMAFKESIKQYYQECTIRQKPCKILVTYDSFRHVRSALEDSMSNFYVVVDEFQSVFTDAKFKSTTEIEFLTQLQGIQNLSFVSATPMLDKYLEMLDEFKDLPYYELDWETEDPSRVSIPKLNTHSCYKSVLPAACEVVKSYQNGDFEITAVINETGEVQSINSHEAVLYVNSVKNICDIISKCELKLENTNVLCSNTDDNEAKIRKAFGFTKKEFEDKYGKDATCIGKVPLRSEPNKMFTICTRTVYLGADFYSTNARTFIFSDANVDSLTVDITIDLPQILGRQRLEENPWKNRAELYYKTLDSKKAMTQEDFDAIREKKIKKTNDLLNSYQDTRREARHTLAEAYQFIAKTANYKDNYVAVNIHGGSDLIPVFNNLVMINDMRSYEIQQVDYKDRFRVFNALGEQVKKSDLVQKILQEFEEQKYFTGKMKYLYSLHMDADIAKQVLNNIYDTHYAKYYWNIPSNRAGSLKYQKGELEKEYQSIINPSSVIEDSNSSDSEMKNLIRQKVENIFTIDTKYLKFNIKESLRKIYTELGYDKTPKASDLEEYFEIKDCLISNTVTGKMEHGFKIIKKKEED